MLKFNLKYEGEDKTVEFKTGRVSLWDAQDYAAESIPEGVNKRAKTDFAWAFFAAKQAGKLDELGAPDDVAEGIRYLADNYDFTVVQDGEEEEAPLAKKPAK